MNKEVWKVAILMFLSAFAAIGVMHSIHKPEPNDPIIAVEPISKMPLVLDTHPMTASLQTGAPNAERGAAFLKYLAPSLKIAVSDASGSGTIVYYDPKENYAYVASCGHLWYGIRSADSVRKNPVKCRVITWYHNDTKLDAPRDYPAEVLFWSNGTYDCSLLRFQPDWQPTYCPIAPIDYDIPVGSIQNSCGCDSGSEVARYGVEIVGIRGTNLITKNNSPRPGRSGGGLITDDCLYIGTCWGTSNYGGGGIGYFTTLKSIHKIYSENGYDWILDVSNHARNIPIYDLDNNYQQSHDEYIPVPGRSRMPLFSY